MSVDHIKKNAGWVVYEPLQVIKAAVVPNRDIIEHQTFSAYCECRPKLDDGILIHNALDGRVAYEVENDKY